MGGASAYIDHTDAIGSTVMETGPAGAVQWDVVNDPWGQVWQQTGTRQSAVFAGLDWQVNDPLIPSATREYSAGLGRWMTPDPVGGHLSDPQTLNKYAYVGNNPTSLNDPSGEDFWLVGGKQCSKDGVECDKGGYVLGANNQRMVVTSASLSDAKSGNKATVDENGVEITAKGLKGTYEGVFINNTPTADIAGVGRLSNFMFHVELSNVARGTLDAGTYSDKAAPDSSAVASALGALSYWVPTEPGRHDIDHPGYLSFRFSKGAHPNIFNYGPSLHILVRDDPTSTVPADSGYTDPFHVDSRTGPAHFGCAVFHAGCQ